MPKDNTSLYIVLGILATGARSGYDVKKKIGSIGHYYKISNGQIYPALKKLLQDGSVTLATEKNEGRPYRNVYSITSEGKKALMQWIQRPVNYKNPDGNELLLKLYFGTLADTRQNIDKVTGYREMMEQYRDLYAGIRANFNLDTITELSDYYKYLTLRHGQILMQAYIDWCDEAVDLLGKIDRGETTKAGGVEKNE